MRPPPPAADGACPACGRALVRWQSVPAGEPADRGRYDLLRCRACATAVTVQPVGPDAYESGVYAAGEPRLARLAAVLQTALLGQPVRMLRRHVPRGGRVLDLGAGRGRLVQQLRGAGLAATGIDPSARNVALAEAGGVPVANAAVGEHEDRDLDAVVLWHVLEHLDDPVSALTRARGWLRPGGVLLLGVPNVASVQRRIAGPAWFHFDVPRHRVHLTPAGLSALLERAGLEQIETHHLVWQHNVHSMWFALLTRLGMTPGFPFHLAKRNVRPRARDLVLLAAGTLLLPIALALEAVAAAFRRGGTVAVFSRASTAPAAPAGTAPR